MAETADSEIPRLGLLRQEAHRHGIMAGLRKTDLVLVRPIAEQKVRGLNQHACPVPDQGIGADGPPVVEIEQNLQRVADEVVRFAAFDIDHKSDTARVMLVPRVIKTLFRRQTH